VITFLVDTFLDLLTAWGITTRRTKGLNWGRGSREEEAEERKQAAEEDRRAGIRWKP
jgi:hypothetical protein